MGGWRVVNGGVNRWVARGGSEGGAWLGGLHDNGMRAIVPAAPVRPAAASLVGRRLAQHGGDGVESIELHL